MGTEKATRRQRSLLLVDDEMGILNALRRCLRRESYEIEIAQSPSAALQWIERRDFDLVLSDLKMPEMSGMDLLAKIADRRPNAALALISGWAEAVPKEDLEAVGICAVIAKPWDGEELRQTLHRILEGD